MRIEVNGTTVHASSGGRVHQDNLDWIIFIHGAGQSHLTWNQQVRAFSYDGYNVLALDLPGHGASRDKPLASVEDMARWVIGVMDELGIERANFVNHSMGGLVCLELGANFAERVKTIAFIATAMTIAVGEKLIEWAQSKPEKAMEIMMSLGHSSYGHTHDTSVPGVSLIGSALRVMANNMPQALPADLMACANYQNGAKAAAKIDCATICLLSQSDAMVAKRFGKKLCEALGNSELHMFDSGGHMLPAERPREINRILREFFSRQKAADICTAT